MAGISYQWSWPAVIAPIPNTDEIASLTITNSLRADVNQVHISPEANKPQVTHGQWWLPTANADGYVVLENTSLAPRQASVQISGHTGNALATQQVSLPGHATTVIRLSTVLQGARSAETTGGIEIHYNGPEHGVVAYAGIEDNNVGYSASPVLIEDHLDPDRPVHEVTLSAPGLLLGKADPAMHFPSGTYFKPYALLHNVSAKPLQVNLSLVSPGEGEIPQTRSLGQISLLPGQVSQFDFDSHFNSSSPLPDGYGHLTASFEGRDGDLMMSTGSVDQSQNYVFEVNPSQQADTASRTICFWSVEGDNDTMMTLWNYKSAAQDLVLTLYYSGGHYTIPIHLEALQSYNLDMMSLIRSQVADPSGTLIPSNITSGSALLSGTKDELEPISVAVSASVYNVRNATCGLICNTCNGVTGAAVSPGSLMLQVNGTASASAQITMATGSSASGSSNLWETSNASVATVNRTSGQVTAIAPGTANLELTILNVPVNAGTICSQELVPCPTESYAATPGQLSTVPFVTAISAFTYGQSGAFVITETGFNYFASPSVTINFNNSMSPVQASVQNSTTITGTYSVPCSVQLNYANEFDVSGAWIDGGTATSVFASLPINLPAAPSPTISFNNSTVTSVQTVVAGQHILLTGSQSMPNCMSLQSQHWTVPTGTAIGGYPSVPSTGAITSGSISATPLTSTCSTSSTCTLYWVSPGSSQNWVPSGNSLTASYSYTMTNGQASQTSPAASATFNVQGPTAATMTTPTISPVSIGLSPLQMGMFVPPTTPGIAFNATLTQPQAAQGTIAYVQYLNNFNLQYTTSGGCAPFGYGPGIDGAYPYDQSPNGAKSYSTNDSPGIVLYNNSTAATASFQATMYLMWQPTLSSSIPVPLGDVTWQWSGTATESGGKWTLQPTVSPSASLFTPSASYPPSGSIVTIGNPPCGLAN
jgi:hypothetical protein